MSLRLTTQPQWCRKSWEVQLRWFSIFHDDEEEGLFSWIIQWYDHWLREDNDNRNMIISWARGSPALILIFWDGVDCGWCCLILRRARLSQSYSSIVSAQPQITLADHWALFRRSSMESPSHLLYLIALFAWTEEWWWTRQIHDSINPLPPWMWMWWANCQWLNLVFMARPWWLAFYMKKRLSLVKLLIRVTSQWNHHLPIQFWFLRKWNWERKQNNNTLVTPETETISLIVS